MSSSSGSGVTNDQQASSSTSSAQQSHDSTAHNENSSERPTSQIPQARHVNSERDAGASTSYNLAVNDETQVSEHSLQDLLTLTDVGEQHQLILDVQDSAPVATYVRSPAQLPTDDGTSTLCNLDSSQATAPELPTDLEAIPETQLMRLPPIGEPSESYPCPDCSVVCVDLERLRGHMENHEYRFKCLVCNKRFSRNALLLAHAGSAHPSGGGGQRDGDNGLFPREVVCEDSKARERHAEEHPCPLTCSSCNKRFALDEQLAAHACTSGVVTESERPRNYHKKFGCPKCSARFVHKDQLDRHVGVHEHLERLRDNLCGICDFECHDEEDLNRHMATHTPKPVCLVCGQSFRHDGDLAAHVLTDHPPEEKKRPEAPPLAGSSGEATTRGAPVAEQLGGDAAFTCQWPRCGKTFGRAVNLARHMKNHAGERRFACQFCGMKFVRSDARTRHVKSKHKKDGDEDKDDEGQL